MDNEVTQSGVEGEQRIGRRALVTAGIGGAALSLLPFLSGRASASATTDSAPAEETTTTAPKRPTADDAALLGFAQQAELTAVALYEKAISSVKGWTDAQAVVLTTLRQSHTAYAGALSGLLGRKAPNSISDDVMSQFKSGFQGSSDDVVKNAADFESALVATHLDLLAKLTGLNGAALVASIQVAEARHVTALRDLAGITDEAELLVDDEADSLIGNG